MFDTEPTNADASELARKLQQFNDGLTDAERVLFHKLLVPTEEVAGFTMPRPAGAIIADRYASPAPPQTYGEAFDAMQRAAKTGYYPGM